MVSYEHERLVEHLAKIENVPSDESELASWMTGDEHLQFLRDDASGSELMIAALTDGRGPTCVNSYIVPVHLVEQRNGALPFAEWSPNPYHHTAARYSWEYSWGSNSDEVKASFGSGGMGGPLPSGVSPLVFFRSAEGISGLSREIAQDFVHAADVYWRRERKAYSKLDHRGDWLDVISQSTRDDAASVDMLSVRRETLDLHLVALCAVLVRVFEFDLNGLPHGRHLDFDRSKERVTEREADFQYQELLIEGQLNRIRGAQVIRPRLTSQEIKQLIEKGRIIDPSESEPVEFVVHDMRNGRITTVSTDPSTTTNYFEAKGNRLPFETSPAFFRSEVLSRYRADKDKYDMSDGWITCRGAWSLRNYSTNNAGQVVAYICYLRELPYEEQIYWQAFNEEPKAGLSRRTIQNHFLNEWAEESTPLEKLEYLLEQWERRGVEWWGPPVDPSHRRLTVPYGDSRDEWARAIGEMSNLVLEGLKTEVIRNALAESNLHYSKGERSIVLLERLLEAHEDLGSDEGLKALREVNRLRNVNAHRVGNVARGAAEAVLEQHGSYAAHFDRLCENVAEELALIEQALGGADKD